MKLSGKLAETFRPTFLSKWLLFCAHVYAKCTDTPRRFRNRDFWKIISWNCHGISRRKSKNSLVLTILAHDVESHTRPSANSFSVTSSTFETRDANYIVEEKLTHLRCTILWCYTCEGKRFSQEKHLGGHKVPLRFSWVPAKNLDH